MVIPTVTAANMATALTVISVALLAVSAAAQTVPNPTEPNPVIIYGTEAQEGEIPFQALLYNALNGSDSGTRCGGALIRPNWVLTAAHCVVGNDWTDVQMGSVRVDSMPFISRSYQRWAHPEYVRGPLLNDIALIKMPDAATGNNIETVPLPARDVGPLSDMPGVVSGWGVTESGSVSDVLMRVDLRVISNDECNQTYGNIPPTKVCAQWTTRQGQSSCFGDSGGPLTVEVNGVRTVIGVVSSGSSISCDSGEESVYTRVSEYIDWIEMIISNN